MKETAYSYSEFSERFHSYLPPLLGEHSRALGGVVIWYTDMAVGWQK